MEASSTSLQSRILRILRSRFFSNPFVNPFRKQKPINFEDVYIPLGIAERHSTVPSSPTTNKGIEPGQSSTNALTGWTLEELRAEIDSGMIAAVSFLLRLEPILILLDNLTFGHDTEYDRTLDHPKMSAWKMMTDC